MSQEKVKLKVGFEGLKKMQVGGGEEAVLLLLREESVQRPRCKNFKVCLKPARLVG